MVLFSVYITDYNNLIRTKTVIYNLHNEQAKYVNMCAIKTSIIIRLSLQMLSYHIRISMHSELFYKMFPRF